MWIELTATTALRTLTFASGVIARPSDDLCDGATLRDTAANPMALFVRGCLFVDGPLVNFQQKLVTKLLPVPQTRFLNQDTITAAVQDPFLGTETFLQYLHGGAVARKRTEGEGELGLLLPGEYRRVHYDVLSPGFGGRITARLLFRALPPYFLRALAQGKSAVPFGDIGAAIDHLEVVEMARDEVRF